MQVLVDGGGVVLDPEPAQAAPVALEPLLAAGKSLGVIPLQQAVRSPDVMDEEPVAPGLELAADLRIAR